MRVGDGAGRAAASARTKVALVVGADRPTGLRAAVGLLGANPVRGAAVLVKPNFNTADPFPGSTHPETLDVLLPLLREMGARQIAVGDRSGPAETEEVLEALGIPALCARHGAALLNFDRLAEDEWVGVQPEGSHWRQGFSVARPVVEADCVVSTCCLKTHGFGGVFTMSLKNSVGTVHRRHMSELHSSARGMRAMIAEVNSGWRPGLIVLDGTRAFVDGGPMTGTVVEAGVFLAATDRVAADAVGLAVLKRLGSNRAVMERPIFRQEQIARAVELGLGVSSPGGIEIVTGEARSAAYAEGLREILARG